MSSKYKLFFEPYLKRLIREELDRVQAASIVPTVASKHVIMKRIHEDVSKALDQMEADGIITHSENVNGIYLYKFKERKAD